MNSIVRMLATAVAGKVIPEHVVQFINLISKISNETRKANDRMKCINVKNVTSLDIKQWLFINFNFQDWKTAEADAKASGMWGPIFWQGLHNISALYTHRTRESMLTMWSMLPYVLPCRPCRIHVLKNLSDTKNQRLATRSRMEAVNYVITLHNLVTSQVHRDDPEIIIYYPMLTEEPSIEDALTFVKNHSRSSIVPAQLKVNLNSSCGFRPS